MKEADSGRESTLISNLMKRAIFEWKPFSSDLKAALIEHLEAVGKDGEALSAFQSELAREVFECDTFTEFPPDVTSTRSFVRKLLLVLEDQCNGYVEDSLYQVLEKDATGPHYKSYFSSDGKRRIASLMESKELISDGTTGLRTWAAGKFLYAWLSERTQVTHGKQVLELGCGAGFTGIALLSDSGVTLNKLILTDHHPKVMSTLQANIDANFPPRSPQLGVVETKVLNWSDFASDASSQEENCDLVIGADIVFDTSVIPDLVKCLAKLSRPAVLANCLRDLDTDKVFRECLAQNGLDYQLQQLENPFDTELQVPLNLYLINWK